MRGTSIGAIGLGSLLLLSQQHAAHAQTTATYDGPLLWTDRVGQVHAAKYINIEWWDDDSLIDGFGTPTEEYLGLGATDATGNVSFTTPHDDWGAQIEFFTHIRAGVQNVTHVKQLVADVDPYRIRNPGSGYWSVNEGATAFVPGAATVDNNSNAGAAVGITQAISFMTDYYKTTHAATIPFLPVIYNSSITGSSYNDNDRLNLRYSAWGAWDVIMHEWGHHVAFNNNLDGPFSGNHVTGVNNINPNNPDPGARLAYGEAVATHLALMAVKDGNLNAAIPNLPAQDVDNIYHSYQSTGSTTNESHLWFKVSMEDSSENQGNPNVGEGDEGAIGRVLWDVYDTAGDNENYGGGRGDRVSFGPTKTFNLMQGKDTMRDLWVGLAGEVLADKSLVGLTAADHNHDALRTIGEVLQEYSISSEILTSGMVDQTPELELAEANSDLSYNYRFLVMDDEWDIVADSDILSNPIGEANFSWTIPDADKLTIGEDYWWVVLNSPAQYLNNDPGALTNWYWSGANMLSVVPEPGALGAVALMTLMIRRARRAGA